MPLSLNVFLALVRDAAPAGGGVCSC